MTKRIYFILAVLGVIFLGAVFFQKSKQRETPAIQEEGARQEEKSEKIEVEGQLVEGFPELPTFPESVVEESYKKEAGGKVGFEAVYLTDKPAKEAIVWYRQELENQGWLIYSEEIEGIESEFFIMAQREGKKVNVFAASEEGKTEISVEIPLQ